VQLHKIFIKKSLSEQLHKFQMQTLNIFKRAHKKT
jgi:hypothetical protein